MTPVNALADTLANTRETFGSVTDTIGSGWKNHLSSCVACHDAWVADQRLCPSGATLLATVQAFDRAGARLRATHP